MKEKVFSSITLSLFLAANASGELFISEGGAWRYYKGSSMPPFQGGVNWTEVAYNDSTWGGPSPSGFGYGDSDDATVFNDMQNSYASVFLRKTFAVVDPGVITRLTLAVDHDDGFVAYLNGIEVARRSMPAGAVTHTTLASGRMASPDRTTHSGLYRTTPSTGALRFSRPSGITI